jgi:ATP-dependent Clp protease ATP-binding subunit ClpC
VRLYPGGWRRRYGAELRTVLESERPTLRGVLDVVLGALDAHLHPELWRPQPRAFERLNEPGRRVLALAQEEARRLDHGYLGTEHVLLGLVREPEGAAARMLSDLGVGIEDLRARVEAIIGRGAPAADPGRCRLPPAAGQLCLTPRAKRVLQRAAEEADRTHRARVGDVHLLLGLVAEKGGVGAGVLAQLGVVNSEAFRARVAAALGEDPAP